MDVAKLEEELTALELDLSATKRDWQGSIAERRACVDKCFRNLEELSTELHDGRASASAAMSN